MDNLELLFKDNTNYTPQQQAGPGGILIGDYVGSMRQGWNQPEREAELAKIKQFIMQQAEEKAQQNRERHALDMVVKQKDAAEAADIINSPDYRQSKLAGYMGQMKGQEAAGEKARLLMPFEVASGQAEQENVFKNMAAQRSILDIDEALRSGVYRNPKTGETIPLTDPLRQEMTATRNQITDQLKNTPKFAQQMAIESGKQENAMARAALQAENRLQLQRAKQQKAFSSAEQALIADLDKQLEEDKITPQQYREETAKIFSAKNAAKVQPGIGAAVGSGGNIVLENKPTSGTTYTPQTGAVIKYDAKGNRIP